MRRDTQEGPADEAYIRQKSPILIRKDIPCRPTEESYIHKKRHRERTKKRGLYLSKETCTQRVTKGCDKRALYSSDDTYKRDLQKSPIFIRRYI